MDTTRLSAKGQLVLPQRVRTARGWRPGTLFHVKELPEGILLTPLAGSGGFAPTRIEDVFGMAGRKGVHLSLDDMDAAVRREAARRR